MINAEIMQERILSGSIGASSGMFVGIKTSIVGMINTTTALEMEKILEVVILTTVGTLIGLLVRELYAYCKRKINKRIKNKE